MIPGELAVSAAAERSLVDHRHAGRCGGRNPRHRLGTERGIDRHQHARERNACVGIGFGRELRGRVPLSGAQAITSTSISAPPTCGAARPAARMATTGRSISTGLTRR